MSDAAFESAQRPSVFYDNGDSEKNGGKANGHTNGQYTAQRDVPVNGDCHVKNKSHVNSNSHANVNGHGNGTTAANPVPGQPGLPLEPKLEIELDGKAIDPIAICGFSVKFPQDATSSEAFWKMMMERRCAMTEFPANRLNADGFYQKQKKSQTMPIRGAHFIRDDLSVFDADFFSISPTEAASMDPMQRWLLEVTYQALENAGMPMESISGSSTAVYTGSFCMDHMLQLNRDTESFPPYAAVGFGLSMLANRLSWFFNFHGPSIGLDSACSSTAMAVDIACQALREGSCSMAIVAGANLATAPEPYLWMSNLNFLSPDSRCYSFDHRANGYARGEGVGVLVLKRVPDAIRDGNTIRAVIRSTGSNEDGRTPGITQPSRVAQERLIKETYQKAGLSMRHTRFFEAHGTGTPIGDPREAQAIGSAFQKHRSVDEPLYVGSVKSNIGHLEGASGMAAIIKSVLVLEKGVIPPNANFERVNPKIDCDFLKLKFPSEPTPWPTASLRRVSINSFGFGGANSHIVIDDAHSYLSMRGLSGNHSTQFSSPTLRITAASSSSPEHELANGEIHRPPKMLVLSAADNAGLGRLGQAYADYYNEKTNPAKDDDEFLGNLAYTLASHRSRLPWRAFALMRSLDQLKDLPSQISSPVQAQPKAPLVGFVFSGQGAQWFAMGRELLGYDVYRQNLEDSSRYLKALGCSWSVIDELMRPEEASNVDRTEYSQTLCTVLQIALVDLLQTFNVKPSAVAGHSSGEIAAAYAGGYLSRESTLKLAYFRGICASKISEPPDGYPHCRGAMLSVGMSESEARHLVESTSQGATEFGLTIACINSPGNITVSGEEQLIDKLKAQLDEKQVFARKLRVKVAYHSPQMEAVSALYTSMIGALPLPDHGRPTVPMVSTVTGKLVTQKQLAMPIYWAQNMVSPVQFSQAISVMCSQSPATLAKKIDKSHYKVPMVDYLVEVGPHAALLGLVREILRDIPRGKSIASDAVLKRGQSATETMLNVLGNLYCMGSTIDIEAINEPRPSKGAATRRMLTDLPAYHFDHSQRYWHESRLSRNYRLRESAPSELLGVRSNDWTSSDARWRQFLRVSEMPWTEQHIVNGVTLYPGAGMLVMAIEAAKQLTSQPGSRIKGFMLRDVRLEGPMDLSAHGGGLEVQTRLREVRQPHTENKRMFDFVIQSYVNEDWRVNCRGSIAVHISEVEVEELEEQRTEAERRHISSVISDFIANCQIQVDSSFMYGFLKKAGFEYGSVFQAAQHQYCNRYTKQAVAEVSLFSSSRNEEEEEQKDHVIHPVSLDAILHLCFTAVTLGGAQPMATSIPSSIASIWISNEGLSRMSANSVKAYVTIDQATRRGFSCSGGASDSSDPGNVRMWYEGLELTNVTSVPTLALQLPNPRQWCMQVDTKVALDKLDQDETLALLNSRHPVLEDLSDFFLDAEELIEMCLVRLTQSIDPETAIPGRQSWQDHYWNWAHYQLSRIRARRLGEAGWQAQHRGPGFDRRLEELRVRVAKRNDVGRLYAEVASTLESMFLGTANPLDLLMETGLLRNYYKELGDYRCSDQAGSYLDLLAHQKPGMKILEVGGGTASATRKFVAALRPSPDGGSLRCSRYDFTDVSASFLERAREEFAPHGAQMTFAMADIERDLVDQGLEEGAYDVVVADGVLHIPADQEATLANIRKVLKPGGKLIMLEVVKADGWTSGFVFGVFPGWWLGASEERPLGSLRSTDEWGECLRGNGFSGADLVFKDFDSELEHHIGCIVSTAVAPESASPAPAVALPWSTGHEARTRQASILIDQTSELQKRLAGLLRESLRDVFSGEPRIEAVDLSSMDAHPETCPDDFIIFLADYGSSFLEAMNEVSWDFFKNLVRTTSRLLWISSGGGLAAGPEHGLLDGVARTLRTEYYELHLVTLALEPSRDTDSKDDSGSSSSETAVDQTRQQRHVRQVVEEMLERAPHASYEQDYTEISGQLHTRRLVEGAQVKAAMDANLVPYRDTQIPVGQARFKVSSVHASSLGHDEEALHYVDEQGNTVVDQDDNPSPDDAADIVVVAVRAVSLQKQGSGAAASPSTSLGSYCAGIVTEARPESLFHPGDRVLVAQASCLASHVRSSSRAVTLLPDHASFAEACRMTGQLVTAHHALVDVGACRPGHRVLVCDGASPVGSAALRVLADRGITDVWTTAVSKDDEDWIRERAGVSWERILPRGWMDGNPMLVARLRRSFDVVLVARGEADSLLPTYVKAGGRYIVASGTFNGVGGQGQSWPSNLALFVLQPGPQVATPESLQYSVKTLAVDHDKLRQINREFAAPLLADAHAHLQRVDDAETLVITFDEADVINVKIQNKPHLVLPHDATYIITGGFGGLGRDMARWLVSRGARHLVLLSRSGPRTFEAQQLMASLKEQGIQVFAPLCDVSDSATLNAVLARVAEEMPPIRGCIQSSMVMTERIFELMEYRDWKETIDPKVKASWNLHTHPQLQDLDFFVLISSMMGIIGTGSLLAYNAANAYEDALARHRLANGRTAVALNLGAVPDAGYLVQHTSYIPGVLRAEKYKPTYVAEMCALLDVFCDVTQPGAPLPQEAIGSQVIVGLRPPAHWKHAEEVPATLCQPFWGHMHHVPPLESHGEDVVDDDDDEVGRHRGMTQRKRALRAAERIATAGSLAEAEEMAAEALAHRVAALLGAAEDRLDLRKPMHSYGLDSLSAIDVRNWVGSVFDVDVPVFEILGGATFAATGANIARAVQSRKQQS